MPDADDPADLTARRWAAESGLIEQQLADRRRDYRRRLGWLVLVAFLVTDIVVMTGLLLRQV